MERLIYSSPLPPKTPLKCLHRIPRVEALGLGSSPSFAARGVELRRISTSFSSYSRSIPPLSATALARSSIRCSTNNQSPSLISSSQKSQPTTKVVGAVAVTLLSVLILIIVHPIIASQAYATVQVAAQSEGSGAAAVAVGGWFVRTELLSSAWTGFFAGCLHTLSGPDHLAALAPLSIGRTRLESAAVGALWGCGHDAGQLIFGLLFLLLKDRLHIEILRTWGTRVVGLTLLVIGAMGIKEASEIPTPCVALENGEFDVSVVLENPRAGKKKFGFATFATGIVHGLQPDALMMVLPALALPSRLAGAAFLGMFLLGTVLSMGSYTVFIGSCSEALKKRVPRITEKLTWISSLVAITLGLAILFSQFFGFNLY